MRGAIVVAWLVWACTCLGATDEEIAAQLEQWLDEPLDLRRATAEELALLPWLSSWEAEAIVGLREQGGLQSVEDLRSVPGLDVDRLMALEPFVVLSSASRGWGRGRIEMLGKAQVDRTRRWGRARWTSAWLEGGVRWDEEQVSRGWLQASWAGGTVVVGDLRADTGTPWAFSTSSGRSRTAPVSIPRPARLAGVTSSAAWRALGLRQKWRGATMIVVADASGRSLLVGEVGIAGRLRSGVARLPATAGPRHAVWITGEDEFRWRLELVREPGRRWRAAGVAAWRRPRWRAGMALTHSRGVFAEAFDPIAGQPVDRPHRAVQVHGARLFSHWRLEGLIRRIWRGFVADPSIRDRTEWTVEGRTGGQSWRIRLRLDREDAEPPEVVWSGRWTEETGAGRRLRMRWGGSGRVARPLCWWRACSVVSGPSGRPGSPERGETWRPRG